jgi:hypothetical protein
LPLALALSACAAPIAAPPFAPRAARTHDSAATDPEEEPLSPPVDSFEPGSPVIATASAPDATATPPGHVRGGLKTASDNVSRDAIKHIVRRHFERFRLCYAEGLARDPHLAGRVAVRLVLDHHRRPTSVSSVSDVGDSSVVTCVEATFQAMHFPAPSSDESASAVYLLVLTPSPDAGE